MARRAAALSVVCLVWAFPAVAQQANRTEARIVTRPDPALFSDMFPPVALATAQGGEAIVRCTIGIDSAAACETVSERPERMGFGTAALRVVAAMAFAPATERGRPVVSEVRMPIRFQAQEPAATVVSRFAVTARPSTANLEPITPEQQAMRYYPHQALVQGVEGSALIACAVRSDFRLECGIEREEPTGWGFGEKALALHLQAMQGRPPAGSSYRVVFDFVIRSSDDREQPSRWAARPDADDYRAVYPRRALDDGVPGRVGLECEFLADGRLRCDVAMEEPLERGFGEAALRLSQHYRLAAGELGRLGQSVGDRIPLSFDFVIAP